MAEILILIAEDEPPIADLVAEVIADLGYTPLVAPDGRRALEMMQERRPRLLITDLMMPYLTGAELIATVRADAAAAGDGAAAIILMTAARPAAARGAGADAVLTKPFDLAALEALVRRFVPLSPAL